MSEITYQPQRKPSVAKRVNGGQWLSLGTYETQEKAEAALENNRAFHAERCPKDAIEYRIDN